MRARPLGIALVLAAVALVFPLLGSAAGELDSAFGTDGKVLTDFGQSEIAFGLAVQADGKIVAAGMKQEVAGPASQFAVARYAPDGSLDDDFGTGGRVMTDFGGSAAARAVLVQGDGKIVVAGSALPENQNHADIALARYNPNGSLDETFGTGGKVLTDFDSTNNTGSDVAIQPNGKLVVAGTTRSVGPLATNPRDFAVVRYDADGKLDEGFGAGGRVSADFGPASDDFAQGVAVAPDGKVVIGGYRFNRPSFTGNLELARFEADGDLDTTFGAGGKVLDDSEASTGAYDVLVQPDHKVVAAGVYEPELAVFRYTVGGSLDSGFGVGGISTLDFGVASSWAYSIARQADGRLVVAGGASPDAVVEADPPSAFAVARLDTEGDLDATFYGGAHLTEIGVDTYDVAHAVATQADGKIVVGGFSAASAGPDDPADFALVRYRASPGYTQAGGNVEVFPVDDVSGDTPVRVTFAEVTSPGETTLTTGSVGPAPPAPWLYGQPIVYYDLGTTATYSDPIEVCIDYEGSRFAESPTLLHYANGAWDEVHTYERSPDLACGEVDSLSLFALFAADWIAPTNPSLSSPSHAPAVWVSDDTVDVLWGPASDDWSGVDGYSYQFGPTADGVPDTVKDAEEATSGATSHSLSDGQHYFHLRTVDNSGNWNEAVHLGPFLIDRAPPQNPALRAVSHVVGRPSTKTVVQVAWAGAADAASGVDGFSFQWSRSGASADTVKDTEEAAAATTSPRLTPGRWRLSLRTSDNAGNWSGPTGIGPFVIVRPQPAKPKPKPVTLCHKGKTIKVPKSQVRKHRKHGDKLGRCKKKRR